MPESRIEIIGEAEFTPGEWLRREVLWASLVAPYSHQMAGWLDNDAERALQQHNGNVSRQQLFAAESDPRFASHAFLNQGKNIAGLISSAVLFKVSMPGQLHNVINVLDVQAENVDKVLARLSDDSAGAEQSLSESEVFQTSAKLVAAAANPEVSRTQAKKNFLRAHKLMSVLASTEAASWVESSYQNEAGTLPILKIHNGGHSRSSGPKIDALQSLFDRIISQHPCQATATLG